MTAAEPLLGTGYFPKRVAWRPGYPHTPPISHLLSVSHHISLARMDGSTVLEAPSSGR
jgi:hypothetical protein